MVDKMRINNTLGKLGIYLYKHNSICVGVSGGSDSTIIVHMIATYYREFLPKVHFVFENTGFEYRATHKHLDYMEQRYNIHIDRIRGESIVNVVRREGIPILSKKFSHYMLYANKGSQWALDLIEGKDVYSKNTNSKYLPLTKTQRELAKYIVENKIKVSDKCCELSKKTPSYKFRKEHNCDLDITGERQSEGGQRAVSHTSCYEEKKNGTDKYMPLFFWNDETKQWYKEHENIRYSDCYEIWGMKRTGCVGCPFNSRAGEDLRLIQKYEPNLYKACMNVFGDSYRLMDMFDVHRHPILKFEPMQISMFEEIEV